MEIVAFVVLTLIRLYRWVIVATIISSWLIAFGIVNPHNDLVRSILQTCYALTEPVLRPIRQVVQKVLPNLGGIDISPIFALVGLVALEMALAKYLFMPLIARGL